MNVVSEMHQILVFLTICIFLNDGEIKDGFLKSGVLGTIKVLFLVKRYLA